MVPYSTFWRNRVNESYLVWIVRLGRKENIFLRVQFLTFQSKSLNLFNLCFDYQSFLTFQTKPLKLFNLCFDFQSFLTFQTKSLKLFNLCFDFQSFLSYQTKSLKLFNLCFDWYLCIIFQGFIHKNLPVNLSSLEDTYTMKYIILIVYCHVVYFTLTYEWSSNFGD